MRYERAVCAKKCHVSIFRDLEGKNKKKTLKMGDYPGRVPQRVCGRRVFHQASGKKVSGRKGGRQPNWNEVPPEGKKKGFSIRIDAGHYTVVERKEKGTLTAEKRTRTFEVNIKKKKAIVYQRETVGREGACLRAI